MHAHGHTGMRGVTVKDPRGAGTNDHGVRITARVGFTMKGGLVVAGLVAAALCAGTAADTLVQLQFVTRHGARTVLPKDAAKFSEGGASLTRQGSAQQRDLGGEIRSFYGITKGFPTAKQYTLEK